MPSNGITVYLQPREKARVRKKAQDEHRSESSVIAEAVKAHFRPREAEAEEDVAARYMGRIDARLQKIVGEGLILKETLLLYILVWLEHTPPLDEAVEESAGMSARARFDRFLEMVAHALQPGGSLANGGLPFSATQSGDENPDANAP